MKKLMLVLLLSFFAIVVFPQNYLITFSGSGVYETVDSVQVKNLMQGTHLTLGGADTLHLVNTTGTGDMLSASSSTIIYPNPTRHDATLTFQTAVAGEVNITVHHIAGNLLLIEKFVLEEGSHNFVVGGLPAGVFLVGVEDSEKMKVARLVSVSDGAPNPYLNYLGRSAKTSLSPILKSANEIIAMHYEDGERLLFKGYGGQHARVVAITPEQSQNIDFGFMSCTDYDGNNYPVVAIGDQHWMAENLKTTHYQSGVAIDYPGTDNSAWENNVTGAFAWYDHDQGWKDHYGALYNWYALHNPNLICPAGWRVPEISDWSQLAATLGGVELAGGLIKSTRTEPDIHPRWDLPNVGAGNQTGFTALPAGMRAWHGTSFHNLGGAAFYMAKNDSADHVWMHEADKYSTVLSVLPGHRNNGVSIRCIYGGEAPPDVTTANVIDISHLTAVSGGEVISDGNVFVTARGVVWSASENPTLESNDGFTTDGTGAGVFTSDITGLDPETTYFVRAYAVNSEGTSYGNELTFTTSVFIFACGDDITDIDGNIYRTVQIGDQCWTRDNLRTTRYNDGSDIPLVEDDGQWANANYGAMTIYPHQLIEGLDSSAEVVEAYGILYNWFATDDDRNLCPEGWYVPSHPEWTQMENFIMLEYGLTNNANDVNGLGNALKSCLQVNSPLGGDCDTSDHPRWNAHSLHFGNDMVDFSALPAGRRRLNGVFFDIGNYGLFWTSTEHTSTHAVNRTLFSNQGNMAGFFSTNYRKTIGHSVRCIKAE